MPPFQRATTTTLTGPCPGCGRPSILTLSQAHEEGRLVHTVSAGCAACPPPAPTSGAAPRWIRDAFLASGGLWEIVLPGADLAALHGIAALRTAFGTGLAEARDAWARAVALGRFQGTQMECEAVAWTLRAQNVAVQVTYAGAAETSPQSGEPCLRLAPGTNPIAFIKAVRQALACDLTTAKSWWDRHAPGLEVRGTHAEIAAIGRALESEGISFEPWAGAALPPAPLLPPASLRVLDPSRHGISAIKAIRMATGLGLKEAKARWDARGPNDRLDGNGAEMARLAQALRECGVPFEMGPG